MTSHRQRAAWALSIGLAILVLAATSGVAQAQLTLTQPAINRGFTLTTFLDNVPSTSNSGPLGFGLRTDGQVLVTNSGGLIFRFPNHNDGQHWSGGTQMSSRSTSNAQCIAQVQQNNVWKYYLSQSILGRVVEIDQDGQDVAPPHALTLSGSLCLIPYPAGIVNSHTGHLFATSLNINNIYEIDPILNTVSIFKSGVGTNEDGMTFNAQGSILYVACPSEHVVKGFEVSSGALVWTSPVTTETPDGLAIGTGTLTGYIYANCNEGVVWEFDLGPHGGVNTKIATGGTRGDFIASDPDKFCGSIGSPSLLLSQTSVWLRLDPPGGGFFGPPTSATAPVNSANVPGLGPFGLGLVALLLASVGGFVVLRLGRRRVA